METPNPPTCIAQHLANTFQSQPGLGDHDDIVEGDGVVLARNSTVSVLLVPITTRSSPEVESPNIFSPATVSFPCAMILQAGVRLLLVSTSKRC